MEDTHIQVNNPKKSGNNAAAAIAVAAILILLMFIVYSAGTKNKQTTVSDISTTPAPTQSENYDSTDTIIINQDTETVSPEPTANEPTATVTPTPTMGSLKVSPTTTATPTLMPLSN